MFEGLLRRVRGGGPEDHDDRRSHPRHPINLDTTCQVVNEAGKPMNVRVRDVSRGGMKFISAMKMEAGTLVRISLPPQAGSEAAVLACVMHSSPQTDGTFAVGCAFSDELSDDALKQFGARKQIAAGGSDKRAWMRYPGKGYVEYVVLPPTGTAGKRAEIANISPTGIGLYIDDKIEPVRHARPSTIYRLKRATDRPAGVRRFSRPAFRRRLGDRLSFHPRNGRGGFEDVALIRHDWKLRRCLFDGLAVDGLHTLFRDGDDDVAKAGAKVGRAETDGLQVAIVVETCVQIE